jgi:alcohol dehydrogenase
VGDHKIEPLKKEVMTVQSFSMRLSGRVLFGPGTVARLGDIARTFSAEKALVVSDPNVERLGHVNRVCELLQKAGIEVRAFAEVEPDPSVETADKAADVAKDFGAGLVVGIGGGSSLDIAKAASVLVTNPGGAASYQGLGLVKNAGLPKVLIPTTAGTGSEVTFTAVLIRKKEGIKAGINDEKLYADYAILDPELTLSLPPRATASTGMDAFIHAFEAYVGKSATPFSDIFAESAIKRVGRWLRVATWDGRNLEARCEMMLASYYGGAALANAGVGACHALSYPLGGLFGVPHGLANALLIPYVTHHSVMANPERYAEAAVLLGKERGASLRDAALACVEALEELVSDLSLPRTLKDLGIKIEEGRLQEMVRGAMAVDRPMANNPRPFDEELCAKVYKEAIG